MTHTAAPTSPRRTPPRGLLARLRGRLTGSDEAGTILLEAVVFMGVTAIAVAAFVGFSTTVNQVQRHQTAVDIVAQQAQGVLQEAHAVSWERLAFNPDTQPVTEDPAAVHTSSSSSSSDDLVPYREFDRAGVEMRQTVEITWEGCSSCSNATDSGRYGTKRVTVTIDFDVPGESESRTLTHTMLRSATAGESSPHTLADLPSPSPTSEATP